MKDKKPPGGGWAPELIIQGKVYHRMGGLLSEESEDPHFNQIFIFDPNDSERSISEIRLQELFKSNIVVWPTPKLRANA